MTPAPLSPADFARVNRAESTLACYESDWRQITAWCKAERIKPLPASPAVVARYLAAMAGDGYKVATIKRHLATISVKHRLAGQPDPTKAAEVAETMKGIRRTRGAEQKQAKPLLPADLRRIVKALPAGVDGARDRALLLFGFASSFRSAEIIALRVEDVEFKPQGIAVFLRSSKTDQEGIGRRIGIPKGKERLLCPVVALRAWLKAAAITSGPLFPGLDPPAVGAAVRRGLAAAGLSTASYSGHSLRSGFVTAALIAGVPPEVIQKQTGHKSIDMLLRYYRNPNLFEKNGLL